MPQYSQHPFSAICRHSIIQKKSDSSVAMGQRQRATRRTHRQSTKPRSARMLLVVSSSSSAASAALCSSASSASSALCSSSSAASPSRPRAQRAATCSDEDIASEYEKTSTTSKWHVNRKKRK